MKSKAHLHEVLAEAHEEIVDEMRSVLISPEEHLLLTAELRVITRLRRLHNENHEKHEWDDD